MTLRGLGSMATQGVLSALADDARGHGLPAVAWEVCGGVTVQDRVAGGAAVDLVALAVPALGRLAEGGHLLRGSVTPLVVSAMAAAVREDVEPPAWADAAGVRDALLAADAIGYSTGPSGQALLARIEEWGLTPRLADRLVRAEPGVPVARLVAQGRASLGFQQVSELLGQPGVRLVPLPEGVAVRTVFGAAVAASTAAPEDARAVLAHYASAATGELRRRFGYDLPQEQA